jgi:ribonucleoside-diphosphate reductase alpha chain
VSTSQIFGNNESFEPFAANIYNKTTLGGKYMISNKHMIRHLLELGLWNEDMKNAIIANEGSVQNIIDIPDDVKKIYLTVWEMSQKLLMQRTALRGAFVDQSQSFNVHLRDASNAALRSVILTAHKFGMKTGSYYIRSKPAAKTMSNNISVMKKTATVETKKDEPKEDQITLEEEDAVEVCRRNAETGGYECTMCSS